MLKISLELLFQHKQNTASSSSGYDQQERCENLVTKFSLHDVTGQTARPPGGAAGAEPSKGHLQDALLTLGSAHAHFGHVQVSHTSGLISQLVSVQDPGDMQSCIAQYFVTILIIIILTTL